MCSFSRVKYFDKILVFAMIETKVMTNKIAKKFS